MTANNIVIPNAVKNCHIPIGLVNPKTQDERAIAPAIPTKTLIKSNGLTLVLLKATTPSAILCKLKEMTINIKAISIPVIA